MLPEESDYHTPSSGIYTGTGGPLKAIAQAFYDDSTPFYNFGIPLSINDRGKVAFRGLKLAAPGVVGGEGIFTGDGVSVTEVVDNGGAFSSFGPPIINNRGRIAFLATLDSGVSAMYITNDKVIEPIASTSGSVGYFGYDFNDNDSVTFIGPSDRGGLSLFLSTDGQLTEVASDSGEFEFLAGPDLNNSGEVLFSAFRETGWGIFVGPAPFSEKVIAAGDALFGSTVAEVLVGRLNDAGQIAFFYRLSDGREGIGRADPIPEPDTLTLLLVGALSMAMCGAIAKSRRIAS